MRVIRLKPWPLLAAMLLAGCSLTPAEPDPVQVKLDDVDRRAAGNFRVGLNVGDEQLDGRQVRRNRPAEVFGQVRRKQARVRGAGRVDDEIGRREAEVRREGLEESTFEELGLDLPAGYAEHVAARSDGGFAAPDRESASAEAERLRLEIRSLGNVNMEAIDELSQLEGRNETLAREVADIDAAVSRLKAIGVEPLAQSPVQLPESLGPGLSLLCVRDPDGNIVELVGPKSQKK